MAGPWEKYQKKDGPWSKYQQPAAAEPMQEDAPWYQDAAQAADDMVRLAASGMTFGFADKIAGYLGGEGTEAERAKTEDARQRAGSAGTVAEIAGGVATPMGLAGRGATLAGRLGTGAMTGAKGLAARSALMGAEGAGYGALTAAGNDQDIATGAGIGALAGVGGNVVGEGISAGINKVAGAFNKKPPVPSVDDLKAMKDAAYQRARQAGVAFSPQGVDRLKAGIVKEFTDRAFLPHNEPGAAAVLKEIEKLSGQNVTMDGLEAVRKMAGNAFIPGNKSNNALTSAIIEKIDDLLANPQAGDVLMGNSPAASSAYKEARDLASRLFKSEKVQKAVDGAELRAASTGSGGNVDNATRQNLRRILEKERGLKPDERAALETAVRGTPGQNALRLAGKLSPQGNGLMAALGIGATAMNPLMAGAPAVGMVAKALADRATPRNVEELARIIQAGGSRAATQAPPNAVQRLAHSKRDALIRALMAIGVQQGVAP